MATMTQDWYGGLEPELDGQMLPGKPADPEMRESASIWLFEENGHFAFPRIGLEAVGNVWENHRYDGNFAFEGGRILRVSKRGATLPSDRGVLGAGGLAFECIEPFRKWRVRFDDEVYDGRIEDQIAGKFRVYADSDVDPALRRVPLKFDVELTMAAPGWTQDLRADKLAGMTEAERIDAGLMGYGWRVEQTWRGEGELTIDGETRSFRAVGNRIHRQSVRPMGAFRGHCWQAAVFPDGRAFGYCAYPPREDGTTYNDGYIYQNGRMYQAQATRIPFLRNIMPNGDDVSLELESELGITRIDGVTTLATFHLGNPGVGGMNNNQGGARYTWDGQSTYGMIERSSPAELCKVIAS
ncbi:MAG: hypothetical protein JF595_08185 [Sphingomonadales bacterium]|nr:hypothetical protein [Sphingomonadales bacterium]